MTDKAKQGRANRRKGNAYESAVVAWLKTHVWPYAERRGGGFASADIIGTPGVSIEIKNQQTISLPGWFRQAEEQAAAGPDGTVPLLVIKRKGHADVGESYAVMRLADLAPLID